MSAQLGRPGRLPGEVAPPPLPIHTVRVHPSRQIYAEHEGPSGEGVLWGIGGLIPLPNGDHRLRRSSVCGELQGEQPSALHAYGIRTCLVAAQHLIWCYV